MSLPSALMTLRPFLRRVISGRVTSLSGSSSRTVYRASKRARRARGRIAKRVVQNLPDILRRITARGCYSSGSPALRKAAANRSRSLSRA